MDLENARLQMIGQQLRAWEVLNERVLEVMSSLPRELFVPADWRGLAYADAEIPIGSGRTLAPPKIQGRALQALDPKPGDKVLEIGTGSGYLTACLAMLGGRVTSVEVRPALAELAGRNLAQLGIGDVELLVGDALEMEFPGRFEVVCVNGSLPEWTSRFEQLLEVGGRLFAVTGRPPIMEARKLTRLGEAEWRRETVFETCLPALENAPRPAEFVF
jgi:protein-L-isoaspartate(D-aspartate) O-methyltransferase